MLDRIDTVARGLRERFGAPPDVGVVLGSGLGAFSAALEAQERASYPALGLPSSNVPGHAGELVVGGIGGRRVACFSGRLHVYEGHDAATAALGIRALARWGVKGVVLSSAVGGVDPTLGTGELLLVSDHINFLGANPLRGPNLDGLGPRFPDLSHVYTPRLRALAQSLSARPLREGVYAAMPGPSYETPAEVRMLRILGADVVGMSLIPESIAAAHAGMEVLAISVVANAAAGLTTEVLAHADVTAAVNAAASRFTTLVRDVVAAW
jgi:purine-nucleoside phosphorylase